MMVNLLVGTAFLNREAGKMYDFFKFGYFLIEFLIIILAKSSTSLLSANTLYTIVLHMV